MEIDTLLSSQNPQWSDKNFLPPENNWPGRKLLPLLLKWLDKRFIIALTGVRRVGKSTLIKQIMSRLILKKQGLRCLYFSFEKMQLKSEPQLLEEIIKFYLEQVLNQKIYEVNDKTYFFFDEIQNIPGWQEVIKWFYDQNENLKFFVSGSSSLFIRKKSQESLAGRLIEIPVSPLSFTEYLKLSHPNFEIQAKKKIWVAANLNLLNSYFEKYLRFGQFPEIITQNLDAPQTRLYLDTIEEKITQQDLPRIFPIKHPEILTLILNQIKTGPGQRVEYDQFAQNAGLDQRTISKYFEYLQKGFMLSLCRNFGKKPLKSLRVAKKAYLVSPNFSSSTNISLLVENYVFNFFSHLGLSVYFQKEKEIDFVAQDKQGETILAEVKYQNEIKSEDSKNLKDITKQKSVSGYSVKNKLVYLITKKYLNPGGSINFIPASLVEYYIS